MSTGITRVSLLFSGGFAVKSATDWIHCLCKQLRGLQRAANCLTEIGRAGARGSGDGNTVGADVSEDATESILWFLLKTW